MVDPLGIAAVFFIELKVSRSPTFVKDQARVHPKSHFAEIFFRLS